MWISFAKFEASEYSPSEEEKVQDEGTKLRLRRARRVLERAISYVGTSAPEVKEERAMLLEKWLNMERSFGELGDVGSVQAKMPKKLKKRRQVTTEDGPAGYEEFIDYLFPEEAQTTNLKVLEAAYRWKKKQKIDESRVKCRDFIAADFC
ncbi:hypothetical protein Droror1_Dr00020957 [Drosera rotundifolia]